MADRELRAVAAYLLEEFRDGRLSIVEVDARWPYSASDPALTGILPTVLLAFLTAPRNDVVTASCSSGGKMRMLERCIRFLRSNKPYLWRAAIHPSAGAAAGSAEAEMTPLWRFSEAAYWPFVEPSDG